MTHKTTSKHVWLLYNSWSEQKRKRSELTKTDTRYKDRLTGVYAGVGGGDTELWLNELGDEGDEGGDDGALRRVGQADEQEGHVAEDPQGCLGEVWAGIQDKTRGLHYCGAVINTQSVS